MKQGPKNVLRFPAERVARSPCPAKLGPAAQIVILPTVPVERAQETQPEKNKPGGGGRAA